MNCVQLCLQTSNFVLQHGSPALTRVLSFNNFFQFSLHRMLFVSPFSVLVLFYAFQLALPYFFFPVTLLVLRV